MRTSGISGYDVVRIALGALLLTAPVLKGHQLATQPVIQTSLLTSRWFLITIVESELVFWLWLLGGLHQTQTWPTAIACFGLFSCSSLYRAVSGEGSCGSFGLVAVSLWDTLVRDLGAVAALLSCRFKINRRCQRALFFRELQGRMGLGIAAVSVMACSQWLFSKYL